MKPALITTTIVVILGLGYLSMGDEPVSGIFAPAPIPSLEGEESLFAEIDAQGNVLRVIVADQKFIDSGAVGDPKNWIQTSSKGTIRKNYARKGAVYDKALDAFIPPKATGATIFNTEKAQWEAPALIETVQVASSTKK